MKIKVNKSFIWSQTVVKQLVCSGVKYACISPGSRNTPLTSVLDDNKDIEKFILPDERSSSFFALGLAKKSNTPVAVVVTSGTAAAELYPAVVEAYQSRVPLILCTADRPEYLRGTGANQTINQSNIYDAHIRASEDIAVPKLSINIIKQLIKKINNAVSISMNINRGPVHLNFQFEKPLEPFTFTGHVQQSFIDKITSPQFYINKLNATPKAKGIAQQIKSIAQKLKGTRKGIIICGPGIDYNSFRTSLLKLADALNYPVFADGASGLRWGAFSKANIISNFTAFVSSDLFKQCYDPDVILQFGQPPTSKQMLDFFADSKAYKINISEFGDSNDPSRTTNITLSVKPGIFCDGFLSQLTIVKNNADNTWLKQIKYFDSATAGIKNEMIDNNRIPFEGRVVTELFSRVRNNCNVMISNSMPVRDVDWFVKSSGKKINTFVNRGASGIDGIVSTALGIAAASKKPSVLVTGDLAFYHDMNGLLAAMKYSIPLTIVLINNNGGGIFEYLPIAKERKAFNKNFITPHNLDFAHFVIGYEGHYFNIRNWEHFNEQFPKTFNRKRFAVIEIKTTAVDSTKLRKDYFNKVSSTIDKLIQDENHD